MEFTLWKKKDESMQGLREAKMRYNPDPMVLEGVS
jgi:hypothetical protein